MNRCNKCKSEFEGKFCPHCGYEAGERGRCPHCGTEIPAAAKFCNNCGKSVAPASVQNVRQMSKTGVKIDFTTTVKCLPIGMLALFSVLLWAFFAATAVDVLGFIQSNLYGLLSDPMFSDFSATATVMIVFAAAGLVYAGGYAFLVFGKRVGATTRVTLSAGAAIFYLVQVICAAVLLGIIGDGGKAGAAILLPMIFGLLFLVATVVCMFLHSKCDWSAEKPSLWLKTFALWLKRNMKLAIGICAGLGIVVTVLCTVIPAAVNIFRAGKVDNIKLGDSQAAVVKVLGEPDQKTEWFWEYHENKFNKLYKKGENLTKQMESATSMSEIAALSEQLLEIEKEMTLMKHAYIRIDFGAQGTVENVLFDKIYNLDKTDFKRTVKKVTVNKAVPYGDSAVVSLYYKDGSYRQSYLSLAQFKDVDTSAIGTTFDVEWSDEWGEYKASLEIGNLAKGMQIKNTIGGATYTFTALEDSAGSELPALSLSVTGEGEVSRTSNIAGLFKHITAAVIGDGITSIGEYAFSGCSGLTSITIPDGVTSIDRFAFSDCSGLTSITIPDGVTSIGNYAFSGCSGLTSITIPDKVTSIGGAAFSDCSGLTSITIPHGVTSIGSYAFSGCSGLASVTIGGGVTSIGYSAFSGCSGLTSITIPDGVTGIGDSAFRDCSGLTRVVWNATDCKTAGKSSYLIFDNCTSLTEVIFASNVKTIPESAFSGCSGLTSITIPGKVTSIGQSAFSGCSGLTSITIPDSVTSIGESAFSGCSGLTSITIPDGVTSIGESAFRWCNSLTSITVDSKNTVYRSAGNCLIETATNTLILGCNKSTIPISVTSINYFAFEGCSGLTSITIPKSVTSIGESAFRGCNSLTSITVHSKNTVYRSAGNCLIETATNTLILGCNKSTIPSGVRSIGSYAFSGCSGLTSITIPDGVRSIGSYAFSDCSGLTSITIPDSVEKIWSYAFSGCSGLTSVTIGVGVSSIGESAFSGCSGLTSITLSFLGATKYGTQDKHFGYIFGANDGLDNARYVPASLKTVVITGGTFIEGRAFYGCSGLTSITIPDGITSIGNYAFSGCSGLTSITIPKRVEKIWDYAFSGCSALTNIIYNGTEAEWEAIRKESDWNNEIGNYTITFLG